MSAWGEGGGNPRAKALVACGLCLSSDQLNDNVDNKVQVIV